MNELVVFSKDPFEIFIELLTIVLSNPDFVGLFFVSSLADL